MPCLSVLCLRSQTLESHFARFLSWLCHCPFVWSGAKYLISMSLKCMIYKILVSKRHIPLDYMKIGCIISLVFHLYPTTLLKIKLMENSNLWEAKLELFFLKRAWGITDSHSLAWGLLSTVNKVAQELPLLRCKCSWNRVVFFFFFLRPM